MFGSEENDLERGPEGEAGAGGAGAAEAEGEGGGLVRRAAEAPTEPKRRKITVSLVPYSDRKLNAASKQKDYGSNFGGQSTPDIYCFVCSGNGEKIFVTVECETITAEKVGNILVYNNRRKKESRLSRTLSSGSHDRSCPMCCKCAKCIERVTRYKKNKGKDCCDNADNADCARSESNWNNGFDTGDFCYLSGGGGGGGGLGLVNECSDGPIGDGAIGDGDYDIGEFDNGFDNGLGSYGNIGRLPAKLDIYRRIILDGHSDVVGCAVRCLKNGGKDFSGVYSFVFPRVVYDGFDEYGNPQWIQVTTHFPAEDTTMEITSSKYESVIGYYHLFPGEIIPRLLIVCDCRCTVVGGRPSEVLRSLLQEALCYPKQNPGCTFDEYMRILTSMLYGPNEDRFDRLAEDVSMLECIHANLLGEFIRINAGSSSSSSSSSSSTSSSSTSLLLKSLMVPIDSCFSMKEASQKTLASILAKRKEYGYSEQHEIDFKIVAKLEEARGGGGIGGGGSDDGISGSGTVMSVFDAPLIVLLDTNVSVSQKAVYVVSNYSGLNRITFFSTVSMSSRGIYCCSRHSSPFGNDHRCHCIGMVKAEGGYVDPEHEDETGKDSDAEVDEEDGGADNPAFATPISKAPRSLGLTYPYTVGRGSALAIRQQISLEGITALIPPIGCTCRLDIKCPANRVPPPVCLCQLKCGCGAEWSDGIGALVELPHKGTIFSETKAFPDIPVFERKCVRGDCEYERLQYDGVIEALTIWPARKLRGKGGECQFLLFCGVFLGTVTYSIEDGSRTYEEFYQGLRLNILSIEAKDSNVSLVFPSKTRWVKMMQKYWEKLVVPYISPVLCICKKCQYHPPGIGGDGIAVGLRHFLAGGQLAEIKKNQESREHRMFAQLCITHAEMQLVRELFGKLLRQLTNHNVGQKNKPRSPFTMVHLETLIQQAEGSSDDEHWAVRYILYFVHDVAVNTVPPIAAAESVALSRKYHHVDVILGIFFAPSPVRVLGDHGPATSFAWLATAAELNICAFQIPLFVVNLPSGVNLDLAEARRVYNEEAEVDAPLDAGFIDLVTKGLDRYFVAWNLTVVERGANGKVIKDANYRARKIIRLAIDKVRISVMSNLNMPSMKNAFDDNGDVIDSLMVASSFLNKACPPFASYLREVCVTSDRFNIPQVFLLPILACIGKYGIHLWLRHEIYVYMPEPSFPNIISYLTPAYEEMETRGRGVGQPPTKTHQITLSELAKRIEKMRIAKNPSYLKYNEELRQILGTRSQIEITLEQDAKNGCAAAHYLRRERVVKPIYNLNCRPKKSNGGGGGAAAGHDSDTKGEMCEKDFPVGKVWTPGLFLLVCLCPKPSIYAILVMHSPESPKMFFDLIRDRFPVAPKVIVYDFACRLHTYCFRRDPMYFWLVQYLIDRFHTENHAACAILYRFNPWYNNRRDIANFITTAMEKVNSKIRKKLEKSLRCMNLHNAVYYLCMFLVEQNNHELKF